MAKKELNIESEPEGRIKEGRIKGAPVVRVVGPSPGWSVLSVQKTETLKQIGAGTV